MLMVVTVRGGDEPGRPPGKGIRRSRVFQELPRARRRTADASRERRAVTGYGVGSGELQSMNASSLTLNPRGDRHRCGVSGRGANRDRAEGWGNRTKAKKKRT